MRWIVITALIFGTGVAEAQTLLEPAGRQGYYLGLGIRNGALTMHADEIGNLGFMNGGAFTLRFGQMAGDQFGFGLALVGAGGSNKEWGGGFGGLQLEGQYVLMMDLAVRAGIGVGGLSVARVEEAEKREDDPTGTAGTLYTFGVSYDWFPWWEKGDTSGGLAFTVFMEGVLLPGDGMWGGGIMAGVEISYWFGFEDNKLALDPDEAFVAD